MSSRPATRPLRRPGLAAALVALVLAGCAAPEAADDDSVHVLASFYPLQVVAEEVGGPGVTVTGLTPPGTEPHDLELSPRRAREVSTADVVLTLGGFQPAVDEVVAARDLAHHVDAAEVPAVAEHLTEGDDHDDETAEPGGDDGHGHGEGDPHFWLDPTLLAAVGHAVAQALAEADPDGADGYAQRADTFEADLLDLDRQYLDGLVGCERDVFVTAHEAFGFLAERYGLEQVGITGLDPESEPSPARLREIREVVDEHGVPTILTGSAVSGGVARTLADDLGVGTAVLDPIEVRTDEAADYRDVMLANLEVLREALGCP